MSKKEYTIKCKGCGATHSFVAVDGELKHIYKPAKANNDKDKDDKGKTGTKHNTDDQGNPLKDFVLGRGAFADDDTSEFDEDDDSSIDDKDEDDDDDR